MGFYGQELIMNYPGLSGFVMTVMVLLFGYFVVLMGRKVEKRLKSKIWLIDKMNLDDFESTLIDIFFRRGYKVRHGQLIVLEKYGLKKALIPIKDSILETKSKEKLMEITKDTTKFDGDILLIANKDVPKYIKDLAKDKRVQIWRRGELIDLLAETPANLPG